MGAHDLHEASEAAQSRDGNAEPDPYLAGDTELEITGRAGGGGGCGEREWRGGE